MKLNTLVDLLRLRADRQGCKPLYTFLGDGEVETAHLTFGQLDQHARAIGAHLQQLDMAGERALLNFPPGLDFISAFFGCMYAGVVAVPVPLVSHSRRFSRVQKIFDDAGAKVILTTESLFTKLKGNIGEESCGKPLTWLATSTLSGESGDDWQPQILEPETLAYLQYTSGSTGDPKGVMITHENVLHNLACLERGFDFSSESTSVSWLPHFHDMGLVLGILQPLYEGCPGVLLSPLSFIQRPIQWLRAISQYQGTHSGGPNFAYDLCVGKISHEERKTLDLQSWQVAYNGAEPIHHRTLLRFTETFDQNGFRWSTFCPAYGLAESTLRVSNTPKAENPVSTQVQHTDPDSQHVVDRENSAIGSKTIVSCGRIGVDMKVSIVDPETCSPCSKQTIGEIWVSGQSVAKGYWKREQETQHTFNAFLADGHEGPFLRTGDLGFFQGEELFVTGRLKDLIIIRGSNYSPQDIERTVEQSYSLVPSGSRVAFSVEIAGEERLVVVQDVGRTQAELELQNLTSSIRRAVAEEHALQIYELVFVTRRGIPKTSSGKIQRQACRISYLKGELPIVSTSVLDISNFEKHDSLQAWERLLSLGEGEAKKGLLSLLQAHIAPQIGLRPSEVDVHESLINVGLESLMAMELKSLLEDRLGVGIPLSRFLLGATLEELAEGVCGQPWVDAESKQEQGTINVEVGTGYPLSRGQEALWFLQRVDPDNVAYNVKFTARIVSDCDVNALERSVGALINRHPNLRTTFHDDQGRPVQKVQVFQDSQVQIVQASGWNAQDVQEYLEREAHRPFDLEEGPVFRVVFLPHTKSNAIMLMVSHHIVMDLWSMAVLMDELKTLYAAEQSGLQALLPPLKASYVDFVHWQIDWLASPDSDRQLAYWENQLGGELSNLRFPTDHPRPAAQSYRGASYFFEVNEKITEGLKALAQAQGTTLYVLLLAAFQVLLSRYAGQNDVVVGSPCAGRTRPEFDETVGYCVNTVVMRGRLSAHLSFSQFLQETRTVVLDALNHQDYPFPLLVEHLQPEREPSMSPLYQVMFVLEKPHCLEKEGLSAFILGEKNRQMTLGDLILEPIAIPERAVQVDLTLIMVDVEQSIHASFQYNIDLYDPETIERLSEHFVTLLEGIVVSPQRPISDLPLLPQLERGKLLREWNQTSTVYPRDLCIHQVFETAVDNTPDHIAVSLGENCLTYRDLNERANRVAHYLRERGVGSESLVGICMDRSLEMVVGLLGILKAGGAYVPLDPRYPDEQLRFMMDDTHMAFLLTQARFRSRLVRDGLDLTCLDSEWESIESQSPDNPSCTVRADSLAYVMYTSGSTGQPKGVCILHRGVVRLVKGTDYVEFNADQVFLQLAPLAFDASTFEIWGALLHGARLTLFPPHQPTFAELGRVIGDCGVTTLWLTADLFHRMVETHLDALAPLTQLIAGGDVLSVSHVNRAVEGLPNCRLVNGYGPTENTTFTCCYPMTRLLPVGASIPIGRPLSNTEVYILDADHQPVPVGVVGELYVGGDGLARGYLNRPDLTAQKFISHPFIDHANSPGEKRQARLYKTGDLVRYLKDGTLEFHGRVDLQVKVRGYRVELEEVEAAIRQHPVVQDVVVEYRDIPRKRTTITEQHPHVTEKGLVANVVFVEGASAPTNPTLQSFLKTKLPSHMMPACMIMHDALPRLPNEKIDRQSLPGPDCTMWKKSGFLRFPRDPIEESIAEIWREVLGIDECGIDENFFDLGGHSLLVTQVLSRVKNVFQMEFSVRCLFENPTVEEFSARVIEAQREQLSLSEMPLVPLPPGADLPLSFSQERLWFLNQLEQGGTAYTIPFVTRLAGPLQIEVLESCINEICRRHEVLRTTFEVREGRPVSVVHPFRMRTFPFVDFETIPESERESEFQRHATQTIQQGFDLACGPLFRVTLFRFHEAEHVLLVTMHHIVSDGWSLNVFFQELEALYLAFSQGRPSPLPELIVQYADFAHWQRQWLQGEKLDSQLTYWTRHLANASVILNFPTDRPRPVRQTFRGASEWLELSPHLTERFTAFSLQNGVTLFMAMLAAFKVLLFRYTGQDDLLVGTPIANRRRLDTEKLIGAFFNTLVLRTDLSGDPTFRALVARVKDMTLEAYAHQDLPFEQLVEALHPRRDLSRSPLFQVMFSMSNVSMPTLRLGDVEIDVEVLDRGGAQFDLNMVVSETAGRGLVVMVEYNTDLFDAETMKRLLTHYQRLLENVVVVPDHPISTLPMITESECQQLLTEWNDTDVNYSDTRCLHHLFEQQVEKSPDAIAVVCDGVCLTYRELNQRANQVAHHLQNLGVTSETLVGIHLDRSIDMLMALLGVLKAGGSYVPLDPAYPNERLRFMLKDSQAAVLITQDQLIHDIPEVSVMTNGSSLAYGGPLVFNLSSEVWEHESMDNPKVPVNSTNLAYVIYTSGSTGQPKGVMVSHRGLVNVMEAMQATPGLGSDDRFLAVTSLSFDIAVLELFLPLVVGAQVVLATQESISDAAKLCRLLKESNATVMQGTPATWRMLVQADWQPRKGFRAFCGGEALSRNLANQLLEQGVDLWNFYGPTETTIWSSVHRVSPGEEAISIGRPLANTKMYVLDRCLQPVPIGVPGELYIGGEGLARGYMNQPALTVEKFIPNPFRATSCARLYKTGDLVKYRSDRTLEFLGRLDHQVKLRGFRIELEEIEAVLHKHPAVQHCVVVVDTREADHQKESRHEPEFEDTRLVAYIVPTNLAMALRPTNDPEMDSCPQVSCISELQEFLRKSLPVYMIPSSFIFLDVFPLTPNGKIDRLKLPTLVEEKSLRSGSRAPRTSLEQHVVEIWMKVLGLPYVGVTDDFFELGGHSLLVNQVLACIYRDLGVEVSLTTFFERPTIECLAKYIETVRWLSESQSLNQCENLVDREDTLL